jgi:hypothetical protein
MDMHVQSMIVNGNGANTVESSCPVWIVGVSDAGEERLSAEARA